MTDSPLELPGQPLAPRSTVATVGTFDGVHRGHSAVLSQLVGVAHEQHRTSLVVTFDPHPLRIVRPDSAPQLLTGTAERVGLLRASGVDQVAVVRFTPMLARYAPLRFVEDVLLAHFGLAHLVIGHDHGFGRDRSGDVDTLRRIGADLGFQVTVVEPTAHGDEAISSTRVRRLLEQGNVAAAASLLGRAYAVRGKVVKGDGRGRQLGFATANLDTDPEKLLPAEGIYAVRARLEDGSVRDGVLHLGPRPTFLGATPSVELHLLDYDADLYDQHIEVRFCDWVRPIEAFTDVEALVRAIEQDCDRAQAMLAEGRGGCRED